MDAQSRCRISNDLRFEVSTRELFRVENDGSSKTLPLGSRAADMLLLFLQRPGELVTKKEIMDAVWPGTAVEDSNLPVQISAVRRALDANLDGGSAILTVPGRGYRFTLPVHWEQDSKADVSSAPAVHPTVDTDKGRHDEVSQASPPIVSTMLPSDTVAAAAGRGLGRTARWSLFGIGAGIALVGIAMTVKLQTQPQFNLSGVWLANDRGTYTIQQSGTQVTWEGVSGDGGVQWTHSFKGELQGNMLVGRYIDHPPGRNHNGGILTVEIIDNNRFEKVAIVGSFVGSVWTRKPDPGH
jgi:DNA-binding winged helix-turn-helix (wHTH) protein